MECNYQLRLVAAVKPSAKIPDLIVFEKDVLLVGRNAKVCDVVLTSRRTPQSISRHHCNLVVREGKISPLKATMFPINFEHSLTFLSLSIHDFFFCSLIAAWTLLAN